jgi:3-oxoacyl-[acyl-carrier protein] reductase
MDRNMLLLNKVAVITGASSGIGRSIALRYACEGAKVVVASRDVSRCEIVATQIRGNGGDAISFACDVTQESAVKRLFDRAHETFGRLDIAVANAGISGGTKTIEEYRLDDWNRVIETNLTGAFLTAREAFRRLKVSGGHIILMSSQAGMKGYANKGPYCAAKFGVRGLGQALSEEGSQYGIVVSSICPGTVDTPILKATNTKVENPINPDAIAEIAVFLARQAGNVVMRDVLVERLRK